MTAPFGRERFWDRVGSLPVPKCEGPFDSAQGGHPADTACPLSGISRVSTIVIAPPGPSALESGNGWLGSDQPIGEADTPNDFVAIGNQGERRNVRAEVV